MTFGEHLDELRRRLIVSLIAVFAVMAVFLFMHDRVMNFVLGPYDLMWHRHAAVWRAEYTKRLEARRTAPQGSQDELPQFLAVRAEFVLKNWDKITNGEEIPGVKLDRMLPELGLTLPRRLISTTPLQDIVTFMIAAVICAIAIASPIVIHQMWKFIGAGLFQHERRIVMRFVPASALLFAAGTIFGYFVMVPTALSFLYDFSTAEFMLTIREYFRFLFVLTIALGVVFQLPVVMVGLTAANVVAPPVYTKHWRMVILGMFVIGAILTPPDPVTQVLMAGPMLGLYALGVVLSRIVYRKKHAPTNAADGANGDAADGGDRE